MTVAALFGPVHDDMRLVEERLREVSAVEDAWLAPMLASAVEGGGKRLRAAVALLAGCFRTYDLPRLVTLAAALELLHTATLIHDDVIDNATTRRGRPSLNAQFKNTVTVMLGDYLFANAAVLISRTEHVRVIESFSHSLMMIATGELDQDLGAYKAKQDVQAYLRRIGGKTAALFRCAGECGALLSGLPAEQVEGLRDYGYNLGMAFQIIDDILDFTGDEESMGKPVGSDLLHGTLTLPALLVLDRAAKENPIRKLFAATPGRRAGHLPAALALVRETGAIEESYAVARDFAERARAALSPLPPEPAKGTLIELTGYVLARTT